MGIDKMKCVALLILVVGFIEAGVLPYNKYGGQPCGAVSGFKGYGAVHQPCYRRRSYHPCGYTPYRRPRVIKRRRCCCRRRSAQPCISVVKKVPFMPYVPKVPYVPKPFVPPYVPPPPPAPVTPATAPCPIPEPVPEPCPIPEPVPEPCPAPEPVIFKEKESFHASAHASASASFSC